MGRHNHTEEKHPTPHDPTMRTSQSKKQASSAIAIQDQQSCSAAYTVSLFGAKSKTTGDRVDCLIDFIFKRDIKSIKQLLDGHMNSYLVVIEPGIKRLLNTFSHEIANKPALLALQLQNNSQIDSTTEHTTADVVAALLGSFEKLEKYLQQTNLQHANEQEVLKFVGKLGNVATKSVSMLCMPEPSSPTAPAA